MKQIYIVNLFLIICSFHRQPQPELYDSHRGVIFGVLGGSHYIWSKAAAVSVNVSIGIDHGDRRTIFSIVGHVAMWRIL